MHLRHLFIIISLSPSLSLYLLPLFNPKPLTAPPPPHELPHLWHHHHHHTNTTIDQKSQTHNRLEITIRSQPIPSIENLVTYNPITIVTHSHLWSLWPPFIATVIRPPTKECKREKGRSKKGRIITGGKRDKQEKEKRESEERNNIIQ